MAKPIFGTTIPESVDIPYDDSVCKLGVDNIQDAVNKICKLARSEILISADCVEAGDCDYFDNVEILIDQDGCILKSIEC